MTDQEWNEQIKQQNVNAIAKAERLHILKQAVLKQVLAAQKTLVDAFRDEGEPGDMPADLNDIVKRLSKIVRELDTKEHVELLGQDVEEFRIAVPEWGGKRQGAGRPKEYIKVSVMSLRDCILKINAGYAHTGEHSFKVSCIDGSSDNGYRLEVWHFQGREPEHKAAYETLHDLEEDIHKWYPSYPFPLDWMAMK